MDKELLLRPIRDGDLELRQFTSKETDSLFLLTDVNRNYLREWLPWVDKTKTVEDTKEFIKNSLEGAQNNKSADFGIYFHDKLVGAIGFHFLDFNNKKTTIGYWLDKDYQGKGIMTTATKILIRFAFEKLKLNRVQINCGQGNTKSCAIPMRLGFKKEGIAQQAEWVNDHFVDWEQYSLLKENFK